MQSEQKQVLIEDLTQTQLKELSERGEVVAVVRVYCTGRYGSGGAYTAIVKPKFFKNGKLKKSGFEVVKELEVLEKWYRYATAREFHSIYSVEV